MATEKHAKLRHHIVKTIKKADKPMTATQVWERVQKERRVSSSTVRKALIEMSTDRTLIRNISYPAASTFQLNDECLKGNHCPERQVTGSCHHIEKR